VLYDWPLKYGRRAGGGNEGKCGNRGLEGGSAEEGECIEPRGIPNGVIFFSKSASPTTRLP